MDYTRHEVHFADAREMSTLSADSIDLIATSPPYPMIEMWDAQFTTTDSRIGAALNQGDGNRAFALMHTCLDAVWAECYRVLRPGGLACINIGDATRKIGGEFRLFSNHTRILQALSELGLSVLPDILWRKPTNAPNKFLGSGMLPAGAYVTYEHEYILIVRKGSPRSFTSIPERARRRRSAFFWEERNVWFSDVWLDLVGTAQLLGDRHSRARSGAFPFELAYRLIQMHSLIGDTVLDPFLGTGTTTCAAIASGRSSVGFEIAGSLEPHIRTAIDDAPSLGRAWARRRLEEHIRFIHAREEAERPCRHMNRHYDLPVVTSQEKDLEIIVPRKVLSVDDSDGPPAAVFSAEHAPATLPVPEQQAELPFASAV